MLSFFEVQGYLSDNFVDQPADIKDLEIGYVRFSTSDYFKTVLDPVFNELNDRIHDIEDSAELSKVIKNCNFLQKFKAFILIIERNGFSTTFSDLGMDDESILIFRVRCGLSELYDDIFQLEGRFSAQTKVMDLVLNEQRPGLHRYDATSEEYFLMETQSFIERIAS